MRYSVYIIYSKRHDRFYIGCTKDLEKRLAEHNAGRNRSTKAFDSWELVYTESYPTLVEARKRETKIKSRKNRNYMIEALKITI